MLKDLSKWKMCSLMVAFIFFFNTTGLAGLAIASNLPQSESSDSALLLSQKIQEVSTSLKLIKNDINAGNDLAAHLNDLNQQYEEIDQLSGLISAELGEVQTEVADLVEQGTLTSEFIGRSTDFANHYHQNLAVILEGISEILNAPQVSVEQVDSVLNNIKELSPEVKANILGNGPELINNKVDIPRRGPTINPNRAADILPVDADMTASIDVRITPEIEELAASLDYDITNMFLYVKNNIPYEPYYGSVKGSVGTYWEKAGNDFDQSSLLIALLRASNIPARYKAGVVSLPINMVTNWVGVETAEAAVDAFTSIGIPSEAITSGSGKVIGLKLYHVWVEAYKNGKWIEMDPSFKQYKQHDGIDLAAAGFDPDLMYNGFLEGAIVEDDYTLNLNKGNMASDFATYKEKLMSYIGSDATVNDIFGYREITNRAKGILPPPNNGGVFGISETKESFSEIPHSMRSLVNSQVSGINYSTALSSIAEESTTISYVPATPGDERIIELYGGIFNVIAFLVRMKPVLKIDGEVVAEGASIMLGSNQTLYSSFKRPDEETWSTNARGLTAGATYAISIDAQRASLALIDKRIEMLHVIVDNHSPEEFATQEMIEETLHITGMSYFAETDMHNDTAGKIQNVVWVRLPSQAIVAREVLVSHFSWFPWKISPGANSIDVKRNTMNPVSATGNQTDEIAWMVGIGIAGSAAEHAIFEKLYDVGSVSTIKILALANQQGVPIYNITDENIDTVLPQLNTYSIVKDNIRDAIEKGYIAICPKTNITLNDWTGQGWIILNPDSGAAGYLLAGRLVTGNSITIINGGSTGNVVHWVIGLLADFLVWHHHLKALFFTTANIVACVVAMYMTLLFGGLFLCAVGLVVYTQLAILLGVILYTLLHGDLPPPPMSVRRRRPQRPWATEYMYA